MSSCPAWSGSSPGATCRNHGGEPRTWDGRVEQTVDGTWTVRVECRAVAHFGLKMSTEISTAGIVPRFSSQCMVFLSSDQPGPGP